MQTFKYFYMLEKLRIDSLQLCLGWKVKSLFSATNTKGKYMKSELNILEYIFVIIMSGILSFLAFVA